MAFQAALDLQREVLRRPCDIGARAVGPGQIDSIQLRAQQIGQSSAALVHDDVVVPAEDRPGDGGGEVHPRTGRAHVPLVGDGRLAAVEEAPATGAGELAVGLRLDQERPLEPRDPRLETLKVSEPPVRQAGVKVADVDELVAKLKAMGVAA